MPLEAEGRGGRPTVGGRRPAASSSASPVARGLAAIAGSSAAASARSGRPRRRSPAPRRRPRPRATASSSASPSPSGRRRRPDSGTTRRGSGPGPDRRRVEGDRVGRVHDPGVQLEVLEDPVEQRERALDLDLDVEQLAEREEEPALERRERDDVADRRRRRVAVDRQVAGQPVHERRRDAEDRADDHEEPAPDHRLADLELRQPPVEVAEAGDDVGLLAERLGQEHAADAQRLLGGRGHVGQRLLRLGADLAADLADAERQVHEERQQAEREQRQAPVDAGTSRRSC